MGVVENEIFVIVFEVFDRSHAGYDQVKFLMKTTAVRNMTMKLMSSFLAPEL
jgi:hypothetical protein